MIAQRRPTMKREDIVPAFLNRLNVNPWTIPGLSADFISQNETITLMRKSQAEWHRKKPGDTSEEHPDLEERVQKSYQILYRAFCDRIASTELFLVELDGKITAPALRQDPQAKLLLLGIGPNMTHEGDELWVAADHEWPFVLHQVPDELDEKHEFSELQNGNPIINLDYGLRQFFSQKLSSHLLSRSSSHKTALEPLQSHTSCAVSASQSESHESVADSKVPKRYRLRGEAYVHGVMHGELFKINEPEWEEIILV